MVNINPICKNQFRGYRIYVVYPMLFTHFYLMYGKNQKPGMYHQQSGNNLALNPYFSVNNLAKQPPFGKMNCQIGFFIRVAIKTAALVNWHTTPVYLC